MEAMLAETKQRRTRRRGNGEGSIYQTASGRWVASMSVGYSAEGKRRRQKVYGWTKKEVQDKLTALQSKKLDGTLCEPDKVTVATFLDRWLEDAVRPTVEETTYDNYERAARKHINPRIGGLRLQKLTPLHVQSFYSEMERNKIGGPDGATCRAGSGR